MRFFLSGSMVALALASALQAQGEAEVRSLELNGRIVRYQVRGGFAVVEGDIIIGAAEAAEAASRAGKGAEPQASVIAFPQYGAQKWPSATMAYAIDSDIPSPQRVLDGIAHWNNNTQFKIVQRTTETNYVHFVRSTTLDAACSSYLGMIGGAQTIATTDGCSTGSVIHELGHAWGLHHEQVRADRNANITVLYQNIDKRFYYNFDPVPAGTTDTGYFDFDSIMLYGATGFSTNYLDTIETVPVGIPIGQRNGLSAGDIDGISRAYGLAIAKTTVTTAPAGLPIAVDGVAAVAPQSFSWAAGTSHTVSVAEQLGADPRYTLVRWSDGGDASHTVTASADQTVFCAIYQAQHKFLAGVGAGSGTVGAFPAPAADGYLPERQPVRVTAVPAAGNQFVRWTATGTTYLSAAGYSVSATDATVEVMAVNTQYLGMFTANPVTTIASTPLGRTVTIDGTSYMTPAVLSWAAGSTHTVSLVAAQTSGNNTAHYQFTGWADGAAATTRTVTAGATAATYTANFSTRYLLTAAPYGTGTIAISPTSADGYYDAGAAVQLTAVPGSGLTLRSWLGDLAGATPVQTVIMDQQRDVTAYFGSQLPFTVLHGASFHSHPEFDNIGFAVTPGEIVTIFGSNLGPASLTTAQLDSNGMFPTLVAGTRVLFDGVAAPVIYTSAGQVSVVVPFTVTGQTTTVIRTEYNGAPATGLQIGVAPSAPGLFTSNASGKGPIAALNQDGSINSEANPAANGSVIVLYATGAGPWTESIPDGQVTGSHLVGPKAPVYVSVGKLPAKVLYAGTAPGLVNGALQINVQLPKELIGGAAVPVQLSIGTYTSAPGTTFAVR